MAQEAEERKENIIFCANKHIKPQKPTCKQLMELTYWSLLASSKDENCAYFNGWGLMERLGPLHPFLVRLKGIGLYGHGYTYWFQEKHTKDGLSIQMDIFQDPHNTCIAHIGDNGVYYFFC